MHGQFNGSIETYENGLIINGQKIRVFKEMKADNINWNEVEADIVCDSSGMNLTKESAGLHLKGGAKKVIMSAPPKDETKILVMGVNHQEYKKED